MGSAKNLTGQRFGRLTALKATKERKQGAIVWECLCDCGNKVLVARNNLEQHNTLSCGCLQAENVSKRNAVRQTKDLIGKKFGKLTVIEKTEKRECGYVVWKCLCECGNITHVTSGNLLSGNTFSCGCLSNQLAKENAPKNLEKHKKNNYVENTRIDLLEKTKPNKNNSCGIRGVYKRKKDGKYVATLFFKGKRYFLGSYATKEEAAMARKAGEETYYKNFLEDYYGKK